MDTVFYFAFSSSTYKIFIVKRSNRFHVHLKLKRKNTKISTKNLIRRTKNINKKKKTKQVIYHPRIVPARILSLRIIKRAKCEKNDIIYRKKNVIFRHKKKVAVIELLGCCEIK